MRAPPKPLSALTMCIVLASGPAAVAAGGDRYAATDPVWKEECGSCHVAYPPGLLTAGSWQSLMSGLGRHFGTDASIEARSQARITAFLERNAGSERRLGSSHSLRITETPWFKRKHRKVPESAWVRISVKNPANCSACHPDAANGSFDDDDVRMDGGRS